MSAALPERDVLKLLAEAELEILGLLPNASNATLLVRASHDGTEGLAVYKPRSGETPLWDFPDGTLCLREYAAWVLDRALGWSLVPPTVLRDGPAGFGALQLFVEPDPDVDVRRVVVTHPEAVRALAAFDVVANNADRKAGHLLVDRQGRLWGVDHGVCFHATPKLRTVVWAFEGDPVPPSLLADCERAAADRELHRALAELLDADEVQAVVSRMERLVRTGRYPRPRGHHDVPWPPW